MRVYASVIMLIIASSLAVNASQAGNFTRQGSSVVLTGFQASQYNISLGMPLRASMIIYDNSTLAANSMFLVFNITGPLNSSREFSVGALSQSQSAYLHLELPTAGMPTGAYWISASLLYAQNGVVYRTDSRSLRYSVTSPSALAGYASNLTRSESQTIPDIVVSDLPFYTALPAGTSSTSTMVIRSKSAVPEELELSIPQSFSNMLSLSTNQIYLNGYSSILINVLYSGPSQPGMYVVPLTLTENPNSAGKRAETLYLAYYSYRNTTAVSENERMHLVNGTELSASMQITNPQSAAQPNIYAYSYLPAGLASDISEIQTLGLNSTTARSGSGYVIAWNVGMISAKQSAYGYYSIENVTDPALAYNITTIISQLSQPSKYNILQIANPVLPGMATNSASTINVSAFYTGGKPQTITFVVSAPAGIEIYNPIQNATASPNQYISRVFGIKTGSRPGTYTLSIFITTAGANFTYSLPLIVSPQQGSAEEPANQTSENQTANRTSGPPALRIPLLASAYPVFIAGGVTFLFAIVILVAAARRRTSAVYDAGRSVRLMRIKKQFETRDENDK